MGNVLAVVGNATLKKQYGGHAATLLVYFIFFGVPEPRIELGAALQQHDALYL